VSREERGDVDARVSSCSRGEELEELGARARREVRRRVRDDVGVDALAVAVRQMEAQRDATWVAGGIGVGDLGDPRRRGEANCEGG
jgi:hypothetical protein